MKTYIHVNIPLKCINFDIICISDDIDPIHSFGLLELFTYKAPERVSFALQTLTSARPEMCCVRHILSVLTPKAHMNVSASTATPRMASTNVKVCVLKFSQLLNTGNNIFIR